MDIVNPATGQLIERVETDTPTAVAEKAARARRAQGAWSAVPLEARLDVLAAFRKTLQDRAAGLARTLTSEVGKPISQSRREVEGTFARIDFFLHEAKDALADETVHDAGGVREVVSREPLGLVANISAWNYPLFVGSNVFVPALLAGNGVLYKPSELATLTGLAIADVLHEAGVPREAFVPVVGGGDVGAALLQQPIDAVFFTGSHATGRRIAAAAGEKMIRAQLELGGKDPVYVTDDVDTRVAAESTADGAFYNTGQSCCSVERIYVHERVHDAFVEAFLRVVDGFVVGDPTDERTYIGPVTRRANLDVLDAQVADAKAKGARVRCGGRRLEGAGNWFAPTVLTDVDHTMRVMRDESFGPVIGIQRVRDDAEAAQLMRDSEYGLTAGVYSRDEERARVVLRDVPTGSSYWNCCDRVSPRLPWSGRGHSGLGVTLGREGILAMTQPRAWHLRRAA